MILNTFSLFSLILVLDLCLLFVRTHCPPAVPLGSAPIRGGGCLLLRGWSQVGAHGLKAEAQKLSRLTPGCFLHPRDGRVRGRRAALGVRPGPAGAPPPGHILSWVQCLRLRRTGPARLLSLPPTHPPTLSPAAWNYRLRTVWNEGIALSACSLLK